MAWRAVVKFEITPGARITEQRLSSEPPNTGKETQAETRGPGCRGMGPELPG